MKNLANCLLVMLLFPVAHANSGELLYNGIRLPNDWPPAVKGPLTSAPMPVPYLDSLPSVIPVDVGRQLFVDDFLIESTTLTRTYHQAKYHSASPVMRPSQPWEQDERDARAAVYSDGVWYDPQQKQYLMWYCTAGRGTALAVSKDGIEWTRPKLKLEPDTNVVLRTVRDSATVWLDDNASNSQRFKLFESRYKKRAWEIALHTSEDGRTWSDEIAVSGPSWDRSTVFYNPFRNVWVASVRGHDQTPGAAPHRVRCYHEGRTPSKALEWKQSSDAVARGEQIPGDLQLWVGADRLDPRHPDPQFQLHDPQLYNLDAFPYESLMVGLFTIWQGPDNPTCKKLGIQKCNQVFVGFSRDGFHWHRPGRTPFLGVDKDHRAWNAGNVQSAGGGCLVVDNQLRFYCSGRTMQPRSTMSTGLATIRRDGFASMDAPADGGELTTRPIQFSGKHLFVNASPGNGRLLVEVLDADGQVIPGYSRNECIAVTGDAPRGRIAWQKHADVAGLLDQQPVRFRFLLRQGSLWSFWVAANPDGASGGYVAAGGPGFASGKDK